MGPKRLGGKKRYAKKCLQMRNQSSTPLVRAKTIQYSCHNKVGISQDNDKEWGAAQNDASNVATYNKSLWEQRKGNPTAAKANAAPKTHPTAPHNRWPWPGTKEKVNSFAPVNGHGNDRTVDVCGELICNTGNPTRYFRYPCGQCRKLKWETHPNVADRLAPRAHGQKTNDTNLQSHGHRQNRPPHKK